MKCAHVEATGYFSFRLDSKELNLPRSHWLGFIEELKALVPASAREYNPTDRKWTIEDEYVDSFMLLRNKWFTDKNQTELF